MTTIEYLDLKTLIMLGIQKHFITSARNSLRNDRMIEQTQKPDFTGFSLRPAQGLCKSLLITTLESNQRNGVLRTIQYHTINAVFSLRVVITKCAKCSQHSAL